MVGGFFVPFFKGHHTKDKVGENKWTTFPVELNP